jgi:hypothetical protein
MSCLFNSLAAYTPGKNLRQEICDYLSTNPELIDGLCAADVIGIESGMGLEAYIQNMRSPSTWGGAIEIRAYCNIYKANVKVNVVATGQWIEFVHEQPERDDVRLRWTGGHYDPV